MASENAIHERTVNGDPADKSMLAGFSKIGGSAITAAAATLALTTSLKPQLVVSLSLLGAVLGAVLQGSLIRHHLRK